MAVGNVRILRGASRRLLIIGLPTVLLVQFFVRLTVSRAKSGGDEPRFIVISIENNEDGSLSSENDVREGKKRGLDSSVLGLWPEEDSKMTGYEDENELEGRQTLIMEPWASDKPSFSVEVQRLTKFITTIEMNCSEVQMLEANGLVEFQDPSDCLCLNHWKQTSCVVYSFSLDGKDAMFLESMLSAGCEVHRFDPSPRGSQAPGTATNHRIWLDWRKSQGIVGNIQHRLLDIMESLTHEKVDVLWMDVASAEWRILESWIKDGMLLQINQLILTIHLQWAGFEVGGDEEQVVRFWLSVLRGIRSSGMRLVQSKHGPGHSVLRHTLPNTHSSYTLSWMRTREQSQHH